jgi:hypothetical protein
MVGGTVVSGSRMPFAAASICVGLYVAPCANYPRGHVFGIKHVRHVFLQWAQCSLASKGLIVTVTVCEATRVRGRDGRSETVAIITLASPVVKQGTMVTDISAIEDVVTDMAGFLAFACQQTRAEVYFGDRIWWVEPRIEPTVE